MKSLIVVGLSVALLSLGLFVPEGHAGGHTKQQILALKQFQQQQQLAFKELNAKYVSSLKDLTGSLKENGLSKSQYKFEVKAVNKQYLADVKAWKASSSQQLGAFIKNGYENGNGKSVPIPGTLLLFAGGFAGVMCWRARQPVA